MASKEGLRRMEKPSKGYLPAFIGAFILPILFTSIIDASARENSIGIPGVLGGVVATSESTATNVGASVLRQGGNAIDAAAAVAFALNVVEPQSSGIGGGGFMMVYLANTKETLVIDSRETAPALADPNIFLDTTGKPFPFAIVSTSGISVGVPGMIQGIALALKKWGTRSLSEVLAPAIQLATEGIHVSQHLAEDIQIGIEEGRLLNEQGNSPYEEARKVFVPNGTPLRHGELLIQKDLAKTFRLLAMHGQEAFYSGEIAKAMVATQRQTRTTANPADQGKLQGRMTVQDLKNYRVTIRQPVEGLYRGYRILSAPPPSSGGLTVLHILKLLERFPLGDKSQGFGMDSARTFHVMIEAMRLGFADRAVWMGDGDFVAIPTEGLMNQAYLESRSRLIDPGKRLAMITAGNPKAFDGPAATQLLKIQESPPPVKEGMNTTHFTIVDREGNIVSYTNTIESLWGTGLMVPGFGFLLNNELTDFNLTPTLNSDPQHFNPGTNDAAPSKRPRSSMAPSIVFHNDKPIAAYGSPGGSMIINSVVNITLNLIDHQMSIQEAIDAPRISQTNPDGTLKAESHFSQTIVRQLLALGHRLENEETSVIGSVQAVVIDETTQKQFGGADNRRRGTVISLQ
jgi:gamma-glutamyltranspeptidase / glutathione hydrolase